MMGTLHLQCLNVFYCSCRVTLAGFTVDRLSDVWPAIFSPQGKCGAVCQISSSFCVISDKRGIKEGS